jgi:hypothetical protein
MAKKKLLTRYDGEHAGRPSPNLIPHWSVTLPEVSLLVDVVPFAK